MRAFSPRASYIWSSPGAHDARKLGTTCGAIDHTRGERARARAQGRKRRRRKELTSEQIDEVHSRALSERRPQVSNKVIIRGRRRAHLALRNNSLSPVRARLSPRRARKNKGSQAALAREIESHSRVAHQVNTTKCTWRVHRSSDKIDLCASWPGEGARCAK